MRDTVKAVQRGKLIALHANTRKEGKSQINKLSSYLKYRELSWAHSTQSQCKEGNNKDKSRNQQLKPDKRYRKSMKQSWFFEKFNTIDKLLARLTKEKEREDTNYYH